MTKLAYISASPLATSLRYSPLSTVSRPFWQLFARILMLTVGTTSLLCETSYFCFTFLFMDHQKYKLRDTVVIDPTLYLVGLVRER